MQTYDKFASFYDLEYGHKEDDLPFYLDLANLYGSPILEIGAGTGRVTLELASAGYEVWGLEHSKKMLRLAEKKRAAMPENIQNLIHYELADMRQFTLPVHFPLCVIPFRTFLHNLTMEDQIATLKNIHAYLQPDGILAFDLFVPIYQVLSRTRWDLEIPPEELGDENKDISITSHIRHDPVAQLLTIKNIYRQENQGDGPSSTQASMHYRYIFRNEMELLLRVAQFELLACYGGFQEEPYDFHSGIMCFIARKKIAT